MKTLCSIIICLLLQLPCWAQQKRALVIAIAEYPKHSGWNRVHADNDLKILLPTLEKLGFKKENNIVLRDAQATKDNIVQALETLKNNCQNGDFVFIHFSCHGQQMEDDNGDEPDGLDESLIPYNAEMYFKKNKYEGENHLRDDELDTILLSIRKKIKDEGCLIVSLDACHSQSGSRGPDDDEIVRGTPVIFSESGYQEDSKIHNTDAPLIQREGLAPIAIISACKSYQQNFEYKAEDNEFYGSLTYSICTIKNQDVSISSLYQWLNDIERKMRKIAPKQTPVIETTLQK